ncbi:MAG TPA: acyltransferase, partial [Mucilaginibacter sp.]|nr:acyltransferase [Mucilaginibacter sp.]
MQLFDKSLTAHSLLKYVRLFFSAFVTGGWIGVDLFFALSGFLVSGLLFNEYKKTGNIRSGRFLIRRGFKLYPSFILFIFLTFCFERVYASVYHSGIYPLVSYLKDLFFLHNYFRGRWDHTWSLDVEEIFYFLLTAYLFLCIKYHKLNSRFFINTYIFLVIIGIIGRVIEYHFHPDFLDSRAPYYSHTRLDSLFFGVLLSYFYNFNKEKCTSFFKKYKVAIVILSILFLLPNFVLKREDSHDAIDTIRLSTNAVC